MNYEICHKLHVLIKEHLFSSSFIEKFTEDLDQPILCISQILSEERIEKIIKRQNVNYKKMYFTYICRHQRLSEAFIKRHIDFIQWDSVSRYQVLSEAFIEKYSHKVCWGYILNCQKVSDEFKLKHKDKIG
jgi:hypothetical protein